VGLLSKERRGHVQLTRVISLSGGSPRAQHRPGKSSPPPAYSSLFPGRSAFVLRHFFVPDSSGHNAHVQESASNDASHSTTSDGDMAWMLTALLVIGHMIGVVVLLSFLRPSSPELGTYWRLDMAVRWNVCRDIGLAACRKLFQAGKVRLIKVIPDKTWKSPEE
jgi:hypothetical protein